MGLHVIGAGLPRTGTTSLKIALERLTGEPCWEGLVDGLRSRFHEDPFDVDGIKAAYERWNDDVRSSVAPDRLVELAPGDGWAPIADALGVAVPDEPYPHANTTAEFRANTGWE